MDLPHEIYLVNFQRNKYVRALHVIRAFTTFSFLPRNDGNNVSARLAVGRCCAMKSDRARYTHVAVSFYNETRPVAAIHLIGDYDTEVLVANPARPNVSFFSNSRLPVVLAFFLSTSLLLSFLCNLDFKPQASRIE